MPITNKLVVAAIDFGTSHSGYAFAWIRDDPLIVYTKGDWRSGDGLVTGKIPTCLLFTPQLEFHSFGYEAETRYVELAEQDNNDHKDWYYFRHFKMKLYAEDELRRNMELEDEDGKLVPAMTVFAAAIGYFARHLHQTLSERVENITADDIMWILTVPAIWDDKAKAFMREAAEKAGILPDNLVLALEPEAAAVYCKSLPVQKVTGPDNQAWIDTFSPGTTYMLVDLGGGTVDVTVHRIREDSSLEELHAASGGGWGGQVVNEAFHQILCDILGTNFMTMFSRDYKYDFLMLERRFEEKKRTLSSNSSGKVIMSVPSVLCELCKEEMLMTVQNCIDHSSYTGRITWQKGDKMVMDMSLLKELFQKATTSVVEHLQKILRNVKTAVNTFVLVGGFSDCSFVKSSIREAFPETRVIIPEEAGIAVLKGAVLFGCDPSVIGYRICRYTYGISLWDEFDAKKHPDDKKIVDEGQVLCKDIFCKFVSKGESIRVGDLKSQTTYPGRHQTQVLYMVYISETEDPTYVTDHGCKRIGYLIIDLPDNKEDRSRPLEVKMKFGDTELRVEVTNAETGDVKKATLQILE